MAHGGRMCHLPPDTWPKGYFFLFIFHRILMKKYHFGQVSGGRWHIRPPCMPCDLYFTQFIPETQKLNNRNLQRLIVGNRSCFRMSEMSPSFKNYENFKVTYIETSWILKWGASSPWSSSLCWPMRNSEKMTIGKTHPILWKAPL